MERRGKSRKKEENEEKGELRLVSPKIEGVATSPPRPRRLTRVTHAWTKDIKESKARDVV